MRDLLAETHGITSPRHVSNVRRDVPAGKVEHGLERSGMLLQVCC